MGLPERPNEGGNAVPRQGVLQSPLLLLQLHQQHRLQSKLKLNLLSPSSRRHQHCHHGL